MIIENPEWECFKNQNTQSKLNISDSDLDLPEAFPFEKNSSEDIASFLHCPLLNDFLFL